MYSCPFSQLSLGDNRRGSQDSHRGSASGPSRQGSLQAGAAPGAALVEEDAEDVSTLKLKHLSEAVSLLSDPPREALRVAVQGLLLAQPEWGPLQTALGRLNEDASSADYLSDLHVVLRENGADAETRLEEVGAALIRNACREPRQRRALHCLGNDLSEFLTTLDGVHDVLQQGEGVLPATAAQATCTAEPSAAFVCTRTDAPGAQRQQLQLLFSTQRPAAAHLLVGSIRAIAKHLHATEADIRLEGAEPASKDGRGGFRYRYLITPGSRRGSQSAAGLPPPSTKAADLPIGVSTFCKAFLWHLVLDRSLELVQLGAGFMRIFGKELHTTGAAFSNYFTLKRPKGLTLSFEAILERVNTPFLLSLRRPPGVAEFKAEDLEIKGQMVYCPESDSLLFVGSPYLDALEGLTGRGLFISDIPLHDATRDVILVGEQARAQDGLRRRMDKLKSSIVETTQAVDQEREKNVSLLHLIFPPHIARRLWLGEHIEAQAHDHVTMLFSDIVGFTSICSTATPIMVINMLQSLYTQFDLFCGQLDVYKVETIGDAYCVAAGLHKASTEHACQMAWMALRMLDACSEHRTHDGEPIRVSVNADR
ncbi:head-specific guanylate cyclase [Frankliniella occidentalis]|uniref:guanylate cyclase n=1 Tax=Frankliniella occidentalis TaxID=133901 RepID=A0A9C6TV36_FRAOC|nr:head-specific guanylate cyclase [Frankliniella occidentalis]XP_052120546.1 head-specific guanylate cyclase [Frankliniella occidentalis]XP_052120547.1 head-specific guanylate cyclase [Frankliniella occidentalis]XP_052120548.1 head-specific guanylate cyclase [Frankliniella occidentalis]